MDGLYQTLLSKIETKVMHNLKSKSMFKSLTIIEELVQTEALGYPSVNDSTIDVELNKVGGGSIIRSR